MLTLNIASLRNQNGCIFYLCYSCFFQIDMQSLKKRFFFISKLMTTWEKTKEAENLKALRIRIKMSPKWSSELVPIKSYQGGGDQRRRRLWVVIIRSTKDFIDIYTILLVILVILAFRPFLSLFFDLWPFGHTLQPTLVDFVCSPGVKFLFIDICALDTNDICYFWKSNCWVLQN